MRIALVSIQDSDMIREEAGLGILTASLREAGHEVLLTVIHSKNTTLSEIVRFNPKVVGFCVYSKDRDVVIQCSDQLKGELTDLYICAGGLLPTYYAEELLNEAGHMDFVVIGEGEVVFLNVINHLMNNEDYAKVKGIAYRRDNRVVINPRQEPISDMNSLQFQSRDLLVKYKLKYAYISSSRGCKKQCTFCCSNNFWCGWKGRSIDKTVDEIQHIISEYDIHTFKSQDNSNEDSDSDSKKERIMLFAQTLLERKMDISYHLNLRAESYQYFSEDDMQVLTRSGLVGLFIGIEAGNQYDLKLYGKTATLNDCLEVLDFYKRHGISTDIGFINFNPYSTLDRLRENIGYLDKNTKATQLYHLSGRLMAFKGTYLYHKIMKDNLINNPDYGAIFNYRFVDERIENLYKFVSEIYNQLYLKLNYRIIEEYSVRYNFRLENMKRRTNNERTLNMINTVENNIHQILRQINASNAGWFRRLIENTEHWDEAEALKITKNYFSQETVSRQINELQQNDRWLIKELTKKDPQMLFIYENYI